MKILIICPTTFYNKIKEVKENLERLKHQVTTPNCYDNPVTNDDNKEMTKEEYVAFFKSMYQESKDTVSTVDAVLVLNFDKVKNNTTYTNYIGASTFLEMYEACMQNKKIFMYNDYPDSNNILLDEIKGFNPVIIKQDLNKIN